MPTLFGSRLEQAIKRAAKIEAEIRRVEYRANLDRERLKRLREVLKEAKSYYASLVAEFRHRS